MGLSYRQFFIKEGVIQENPDEVFGSIPGGTTVVLRKYDTGNPLAFFISKDFSMWLVDGKHCDIREVLKEIYNDSRTETRRYHDNLDSEFGLYSEDGVSTDITNAGIKFDGNVKSLFPIIDNIYDFYSAREMTPVTGRLWTDDDVQERCVSFWCHTKRVREYQKQVIDFVKKFGDSEDFLYDTLDRYNNGDPLYTYSEMFGSSSDRVAAKAGMTPKQLADLMAKAHVDPNAAKRLDNLGLGKSKSSKNADKAKNGGFDTVAAFNNARQFSEGSVKLGDLLR